MKNTEQKKGNEDFSKKEVPKGVWMIFLWETFVNFVVGGSPVYPFTDKCMKRIAPQKSIRNLFWNIMIAILVIGIFYLLIKYKS